MSALSIAQLDNGLELSYLDSWASLEPSARPGRHTTLVCLHGVGFNSAIWQPLLPSLTPSIRLLAYNQRSYADSSPAFPIRENGGVDAAAAYLVDLMRFLDFAVRELGIKEKEEGGVVLMPAAAAPAEESFLTHLPPSGLPYASLLDSHIRSLLLFEPPGSAFGRAPTVDYTGAMAAVSPPNIATPEHFAEAFAGWIGGYSAPSKPGEPAVTELPPSGLAALSPELLREAWEPQAVAHGFAWRMAASPAVVSSLALSTLRNPALPVGLVYGGRTVGYCLDTAALLSELWREEVGRGRKGIRKVEGTNHFAFVHKPVDFVDAVVELIDELK
ncbi:hypothetical protein JCM10213v2_000904 [Rhodosporidiobolus nylandii]